jgi:hypothetical protein
MTLLAVVRDVCMAVGVTAPSSVFSGITGNRTMQEMLSLANEMAQRIAYDFRDWTKFRKTASLVGDGHFVGSVWTGAMAFNLPADYKRMLLTSNVWRSTSAQAPMMFIPDADEWLNRRALSWYDQPYGEWTMIGGQMLIAPIMGVGTNATFAYMHKNCITLAAGGVASEFLADTDSFALDERLLKLGMIWQWKAGKGGAYAEDLSTYGDALNFIAGRDAPAPIIVGRRPMPAAVQASYPYPMP